MNSSSPIKKFFEQALKNPNGYLVQRMNAINLDDTLADFVGFAPLTPFLNERVARLAL
jgi:hypothetical protein